MGDLERGPAQAKEAVKRADLAGLDAAGLDGQTVRANLAARTRVDHVVYSETLYPRLHLGWSDLASATEQKLRYIRAPLPELYDLSNDPGERRNLVGSRTGAANAMAGWIARTADSSKPKDPDSVPADVRARLKSLGYLASSSARLSPSSSPRSGARPTHYRRAPGMSPRYPRTAINSQ